MEERCNERIRSYLQDVFGHPWYEEMIDHVLGEHVRVMSKNSHDTRPEREKVIHKRPEDAFVVVVETGWDGYTTKVGEDIARIVWECADEHIRFVVCEVLRAARALEALDIPCETVFLPTDLHLHGLLSTSTLQSVYFGKVRVHPTPAIFGNSLVAFSPPEYGRYVIVPREGEKGKARVF